MNGVYKKGESLHEGRVFYKKNHSSWSISWDQDAKMWIFDKNTENMNKNSEAIVVAKVQEDVAHPGLVQKNWKIFNGSEYQEDSIKIFSSSAVTNSIFVL